MSYKYDLTGKRYGKLTVIEYVGNNPKTRSAMWRCKCDCGNETIVATNVLNHGDKRSCGCLASELLAKRNYRHGLCNSRLYGIYRRILQRCYDPNVKDYRNYGSRGIAVCEKWLGDNGFMNFYNWSVSHGYSGKLSIDRIDNNRGYSPDNCRWATIEQQVNNRRVTRYVKINGEVDTVARLSRKYHIPYHTLYDYANGDKNCKYTELHIEVV